LNPRCVLEVIHGALNAVEEPKFIAAFDPTRKSCIRLTPQTTSTLRLWQRPR
jgi:hypothetical protein